MTTRHKLNLTNQPITNFQLPPTQRKPTASTDNLSSVKVESSSISTPVTSFTTIKPHQIIESPTVMSEDDDDILELQELKNKQLQLETKFLAKIPIFKSPLDSNITDFLSKVEDVFNMLKYPDDIRLTKIGDKLDENLQLWFTNFRSNVNHTWHDFKQALPNCLNTSDDDKPDEPVEKPSLLDVLRGLIFPFTGDNKAHEWLVQTNLKFSELQLTFHDRLQIIPYFLVGNAMIWYSLNKRNINCYTDFCELFTIDFIKSIPIFARDNAGEPPNKLPGFNSSILINDNSNNNSIDCSTNKTTLPTSVISSTISKAFIDRFIKAPVKFYDSIDSGYSYKDPSPPPLIIITTNVNNKTMKLMLDTGATCSFINAQCLTSNIHLIHLLIEPRRFFMADDDIITNICAFVEQPFMYRYYFRYGLLI